MVLQLILILGIIVVGLYVFGIGTDFLDDIITSFDEKIAKQGETVDPTFTERVNLAKDTNTRVCDLQITFHASAYGFSPLTPDPLEGLFGDINLFHGDIAAFGDFLFRPLAGNPNIFEYQWFCTGGTSSTSTTTESGTKTIIGKTIFGETIEISVPEDSFSTGGDEVCVVKGEELICSQLSFLGLLSWNLAKNQREGLEQLSVFGQSTTDRETIRINFFGKSLTTGKDLGSPQQEGKGTDANPFTKSIMLPRGVDFPVDYSISFTLTDVTEDNYVITFWDNEFLQNGESPGHRFSPKDVCKPGLQRC